MIKLFGIKNCGTVKKAQRWLESNGREYVFIDFRKDPIPNDTLLSWVKRYGLTQLINRRSTSWRQLSTADQVQLNKESFDDDAVLTILQNCMTVIKRPVLEIDDHLIVGFNEATYFNSLID